MFATAPPPAAPFTATSWTFGSTSAFPGPDASGTQRNPTDHKQDCLNPSWSAPADHYTFEATKDTALHCWKTDLATSKVLVRTGDKITYNVTPQAQQGAWPAIWTWKDGGNELDLFEYHGDHPNRVEFANHVTGESTFNIKTAPGRPYQITVTLGTDHVSWRSVNGYLMYQTKGLPANWSSYLIVSMSVDNGTWHVAPSATQTHLFMKVNSLQVTR